MQQNWNLVRKWNKKYSQGLGRLWIPPFSDGCFRLSHTNLKNHGTEQNTLFAFYFVQTLFGVFPISYILTVY